MKNLLINVSKAGLVGVVVGTICGKIQKDENETKSWKKAVKNGLIVGAVCAGVSVINYGIEQVIGTDNE